MPTVTPESNSRFGISFLNAPIGLFHLTLEGEWLEVNPKLCENIGYSEAELKTLSLMAIAHPENRPALQAGLAGLCTGHLTTYEQELRYFSKNNQPGWINLTLSIIDESPNTPPYLLGIIRELPPNSQKTTELSPEQQIELFQQELENTSNLLNAIINGISDIVFAKDTQGRFLLLNQAGIHLINQPLEEILGKNDVELFGSETGEGVMANDRHLIATGEPQVVEEIAQINNERRTYLSTKSVYRDRQGHILGIVGTTRDITERKTLEEELALRQARFDAFFSAAPAGMLILDNQLRYIQVNSAAAEIHGLSVVEHLGKTVSEVVPKLAPIVEPLYRQVLETGKAILHLGISGEVPTTPGLLRSWEVSYFPLTDNTNQIRGLGVVGIEVTEQKAAMDERERAEAALRASEQRYQILTQISPVGIFQAEIAGNCIYVNERTCYLTGRSAEQLFNRGWAEAIHPEDREQMVQAWQAAMDSQTYHYQSEYRFLRPNGDSSWVLCQALPEVEPDGTIKSYVGTLTDISDRKYAEQAIQQSEARLREQTHQLETTLQELQQAQAQLIQSEKMSSLGQLVAGVAHEINNPVNFIYGNLAPAREYTSDLLRLLELYHSIYPNPTPEILEEMEAIDLEFLQEDLPKLLSSMEVGADRIRQIVLSLRNFSRLDEAEMKAVNIHEGIDSTLLILQNRLKVKSDYPGVEVIKEYGQLPLVECYAGQLNQVFMNILTNAIDALDDYHKQRPLEEVQANPGKIWIQTQHNREKDRAVIRLKDNGAGMSESVRSRLFNPFFTTKPVGKGTGLGLAISHQIIIEKHNGTLECFSSPGQGTEFLIEIPLHQQPR